MERIEMKVGDPEKAVKKFLSNKEVKKAFVIDHKSIVVFFKSKKTIEKNFARKINRSANA